MAVVPFTWAGVASKSQAGAGTGTSDVLSSFHTETREALLFTLKVTAAAAAAGDTLDVWVEHSWDDGTTWDDFVHFTQVLGNGGTLTHLAQWIPTGTAPTAPLHKAVTKTLAAGVNQGPVGALLRAEYTTATAGTANFTWVVQVSSFNYGR